MSCIECDTPLGQEIHNCRGCGEDRYCAKCARECEEEHRLEGAIFEEEFHESLKYEYDGTE
jgi:predicted amidophosphoribosyltransferase